MSGRPPAGFDKNGKVILMGSRVKTNSGRYGIVCDRGARGALRVQIDRDVSDFNPKELEV